MALHCLTTYPRPFMLQKSTVSLFLAHKGTNLSLTVIKHHSSMSFTGCSLSRKLLSIPEATLPTVFMSCYGSFEAPDSAAFLDASCSLFAQLGARGISTIMASGDDGVGDTCILPNSKSSRFQPTYPSSCPFVISVGGTTGINPERAISFSSGGFSDHSPRPAYQATAVDAYLQILADGSGGNTRGTGWAGLYKSTGRGYPDVAAQSSDFFIVDGGQFALMDRTS
jgi:tripeptidyl-peptidase-1